MDRDGGYQTAEGALNGDAGIRFREWMQEAVQEGYAPGPSQDPADPAPGFRGGRYVFSWNGNWRALTMIEAFDDVVFLPAPDFGNGNGSIIGAASWQFAVSGTTEHPEGAAAFIEFVLDDKYLAAFSNGISLIPATPSAATRIENHAEGGPMIVLFKLSAEQGEVRPVTPGCPVAATIFQKAVADIANGADVGETLDDAVADIEANSGHGHGGQGRPGCPQALRNLGRTRRHRAFRFPAAPPGAWPCRGSGSSRSS